MSDKIYCVYTHKIDCRVFYVGCGDLKRPYVIGRKGKDRNKKWFNVVENNNYVYDIDIIYKNKDKSKCLSVENFLTIYYKYMGECECNINISKYSTKESRQNISKGRVGKLIGKDNPFYGKTHSEEVLKKIIKANVGRKYSKETNMKKARYGYQNSSSNAVVCVFKDKSTKGYPMIKTLIEDTKCLNASAYARGILGNPKHYWKGGECFIYYVEDYYDYILQSTNK